MADARLMAIHAASNTSPMMPQFYNQYPQQHVTFREAAASYIAHGGCSRYLPRVIEHLGDKPVIAIIPYDITQMALALYPDAKNVTKNRQALSPARAVLMHAYERGWCGMIKVRSFKEEKPRRRKSATTVWLHCFLLQCHRDGGLDHLAALVLFMGQTGARVSEAVRLQWSEVDLQARTAVLLKTKTSTNSVRHLTDDLVDRLRDLRKGASSEARVFRYTCRNSVNERIQAVCRRAGIEYISSHRCGRYYYANSALDAGLDVRTVMEGGGWESGSVFLGTYVRSRLNAGRAVADRLNNYRFSLNV